jgi:membrane protease YdiL (CAAX protease family)
MGTGYEVLASLDIAFVSLLQVAVAFFLSFGIDKVVPHTDDRHKATVRLLLETGAFVGALAVVLHYSAKLMWRIPFPFLGLWGYNKRISEWKGLTLLSVFALIYCDTVQRKIQILRTRKTLTSFRRDKAAPREIANF